MSPFIIRRLGGQEEMAGKELRNMMHRGSRLLTVSLALLGCDLEKSSLGDLPQETAESGSTETEGDSEGSGTGAEDGSTTIATGTEDSGAAPGGLGSQCEHAEGVHPEATLLTFPALDCDSHMCLFVYQDTAVIQCMEDADCHDPVVRECGPEGTCRPRADYVAARSMCTQTCETADDCVAPDGSSCATGFSCTVMATLGDQCCQKVCACNDDLIESPPSDADISCEQGMQEGCCDQDPVPEACGG